MYEFSLMQADPQKAGVNYDKEFIVCSLDLLSGLAEGLGSSIESLVSICSFLKNRLLGLVSTAVNLMYKSYTWYLGVYFVGEVNKVTLSWGRDCFAAMYYVAPCMVNWWYPDTRGWLVVCLAVMLKKILFHVVQVSRSDLRDLLLQCCADEAPDVRQSALALLGDLVKVWIFCLSIIFVT